MAHNNGHSGEVVCFPSVKCSVAEESAMSQQCVSQSGAVLTPGIGFGDYTHFGVLLSLPKYMASPYLNYGEVGLLNGWRMARMCSSLQHFRVGSRFSDSTPDDLRNLLESMGDDEMIARLQNDFNMDNCELSEFLDSWERARPDPEESLGWLVALREGSYERTLLGSALRDALHEDEIDAAPALIAQLEVDEEATNCCDDSDEPDSYWPGIG